MLTKGWQKKLKKIEKKFGGYQIAHTFALPFTKGVVLKTQKQASKKAEKSQKNFQEVWLIKKLEIHLHSL